MKIKAGSDCDVRMSLPVFVCCLETMSTTATATAAAAKATAATRGRNSRRTPILWTISFGLSNVIRTSIFNFYFAIQNYTYIEFTLAQQLDIMKLQ